MFPVMTTHGSTYVNNDRAVAAMSYAAYSYDFYSDIFGRNSFDNKGGLQVSCSIQLIPMPVHGTMVSHTRIHLADNTSDLQASKSEQNRVWYMTLSATEYTHSVEQSTSSMLYERESGAIMEEQLSDIFGELIEDYANRCNFRQPNAYRKLRLETWRQEYFRSGKIESVLRFIKENIGRKPLNSRTRETIAATFTITAR